MAAKQLYQFTSRHQLSLGAYVEVNGPWDKFGVVLKSTPKPDGAFLNLIRGCEKRVSTRPVASF